MEKELDKDTQKVITEGEKISRFVDSDDWKLIKGKLFQKIALLNAIDSIPLEKLNSEELAKTVRERASVVDIVVGWINEIEGTSQAHKTQNAKFVKETSESEIIRRFPNEED